MNYNINDIMPYIENYEFLEYFTSREEEVLVSSVEIWDDKFNFNWEYGATKLVIIPENNDYVIKIPFNAEYDEYDKEYHEYSQNYCETEISLYNKILFETNPLFAQFFLPLTPVKEFKDWEVYIQPKCQAYNNTAEVEKNKSYSKGSMEKVKSKKLNQYIALPVDWLAAVTEVLKDVRLVKEFINVLEEYDITYDLHQGNFGYCNGKPVIFDYGGFYD